MRTLTISTLMISLARVMTKTRRADVQALTTLTSRTTLHSGIRPREIFVVAVESSMIVARDRVTKLNSFATVHQEKWLKMLNNKSRELSKDLKYTITRQALAETAASLLDYSLNKTKFIR